MINRSNLELHFVRGRDPLPTVEVQVKSLEGEGLNFSEIVSSAITRFAANNPGSKATIFRHSPALQPITQEAKLRYTCTPR